MSNPDMDYGSRDPMLVLVDEVYPDRTNLELHVPEDKPYAPRGESEPTMVIAWMALAVLVALLAVAVGVVVTR